MDNRTLIQAAIIGGLVTAMSDALPLLNFINCLCCLGFMSGGIIAVLYLRKQGYGHFFTTPELIQIAIYTGVIGAFINFFLNYMVYQMMGNWQVEWMLNMMDQMEELPPLWEDLYHDLQQPEAQMFAGTFILIRSLLIFPIFTFLGSVVANRLTYKNRQDDTEASS